MNDCYVDVTLYRSNWEPLQPPSRGTCLVDTTAAILHQYTHRTGAKDCPSWSTGELKVWCRPVHMARHITNNINMKNRTHAHILTIHIQVSLI